jgi:hypothetical protein
MKSYNGRNPAIAAIATWFLLNVVVPAKAFQYGCAADRDERKGLPYTAAMEWRKAAELTAETRAAEYCWRQWERIMHLPRRLAGPIGTSEVIAFASPVASAPRPAVRMAIEQISFQDAA